MRRANRFAAIGFPFVAIVACGRFGFEDRRDAGDADIAFDVMMVDTDSSPSVTYVKPIVQRHPGAGSADVFQMQASNAGDFIAMQVACADTTTAPPSVSVSAPQWMFYQSTFITNQNQLYAAQYYAFAPDTNVANVNVTWQTADCDIGKSVLADEFTNNDTTVYGYDSSSTYKGTGDCIDSYVTQNDRVMVWTACFSRTALGGLPIGFQPGADNGGGDYAAYRLENGSAGTNVPILFPNSSDYVITTVGIKPP